ncbi:MAG: HNH endonuclease [Firmicutes bacterium]|nr:HNH endonuclease [Bacillota bacterium]
MESFKSHFRNEYGERWFFEYNYEANRAFVTGDDIGDEIYPVIEGRAPYLILNEDESVWLKSSWEKATAGLNKIGLYLDLDTEFVAGKKYCYLTNDICPICLEEREYFEVHHCVPKVDGGSDDYRNLLNICGSCHALIAGGCVKERLPRFLAAYYHQLMYFGIDFFLIIKRQPGGFFERSPAVEEMLESYLQADQEHQHKCDEIIRNEARLLY